jgi:hypothetical protein
MGKFYATDYWVWRIGSPLNLAGFVDGNRITDGPTHKMTQRSEAHLLIKFYDRSSRCPLLLNCLRRP